MSIWEEKGYIKPLPPLRPYPLQLVKEALSEVQRKGDKPDVVLAENFLKGFQGSILPVQFEIHLSQDKQLKGTEYQSRIVVVLASTGSITEQITYSFGGGLKLKHNAEGNAYPRWTPEYGATLFDEGKPAGSVIIEVGNTELDSYGLMTGAFFVGTERFYAQAGLVRTSFGPVMESPVIGAQCPQAGHFSVTYRSQWFTISSVFLELVGKYGVRPTGEVYSLKSEEDYHPQKYPILHSANIYPFDWLNVDFFQSKIFGRRISPVYFIPLPFFPLYMQAYIGDWDNAFIGLPLKSLCHMVFDTISSCMSTTLTVPN